MKYTAALVVASAVAVSADCSTSSFEELGNWFCEVVSHIKYSGLETTGTYQAVTSMDESGNCATAAQAYSGSIAPFNEELSVHIRGPTQLKTFAVYTPSTSTTRKRAATKSHAKRHGHQNLHKKYTEEKEEKRALGDLVVATIDGKVETWANNWSGESTATAAAAAATTAGSTTHVASSKVSSASSSTSTSSDYVAAGDYERVAYYNAETLEADGVAFLGSYGGAGSGTFDTVWGASLSYLNEDGTGGAASPTVLQNVLVGDNKEFAIFSDKECADGDAACGYARPGSVAHHGFDGADKVFLFEFTMPLSGDTGFNGDMPAIWLLNAKIPRTMQYGDCSCWESGCGEADIFEVLASGDTKAKSTFHFANSLGSSDYFDRPTSDYVKAALVFQASSATASIKILDPSVEFSSTLASTLVETFVDDQDDTGLSTLMSFLSS
ncbi:TOS1 protein [Xylariales sp. AK1849]|nr:TOS1 protein [Xylariales sp. AK1849]